MIYFFFFFFSEINRNLGESCLSSIVWYSFKSTNFDALLIGIREQINSLKEGYCHSFVQICFLNTSTTSVCIRDTFVPNKMSPRRHLANQVLVQEVYDNDRMTQLE